MSEARNAKKEKNQNIKVFVRVRPPIDNEKNNKGPGSVLDVASSREVVVNERSFCTTKKFTFDRVFDPSCKQIDVYEAVVSPLVAEVLAGYNCTVFAYGQTGTGKTFTMEGFGNDPSVHWQSDTAAGLIPRTLSHLFDELYGTPEYTVRVSYLELYNEELFDLLSPLDDISKKRLYEDASKKVRIDRLTEVRVSNKSEVYEILRKGSERRQTAPTLMNATSSRSHSVFTVTVHIKEPSAVDSDEFVKVGKINLVDLAGSENIGRSGANGSRAREAGNINQSLLTLGRVITALVERAPHVPYRESKLTRLLQESLGGRTKTSIIATVSPAAMDVEETLSTLDYAHRAKNITNRPEVNQKLQAKVFFKEHAEIMERLRRDLLATQERNGVYMDQGNYDEMQNQIQFLEKEIEEKINQIKALGEAIANKEQIFNDLNCSYEKQALILMDAEELLDKTKRDLESMKVMLEDAKLDRDIQKHLVEKHVSTEKELSTQASALLKVAEMATSDTLKLHDKIVRNRMVGKENEKIQQTFQENILGQVEKVEQEILSHVQNCIQFCVVSKNDMDSQTKMLNDGINASIEHISKNVPSNLATASEELYKSIDNSYKDYNTWLLDEMNNSNDFSEKQKQRLSFYFKNLSTRYRGLWSNQISSHLQSLNSVNLKKMDDVMETTKASISHICENYNKDLEQLVQVLGQLRETVESNLQVERKKAKERELMYHHVKQAYTLMEAYKKSDSKNPITNHLDDVNQRCSNMKNLCIANRRDNTSKAEAECSKIKNLNDSLTLEMTNGLEKNWKVADTIASEGEKLVQEMQCEISDRLTCFGQHQESIKNSQTSFKTRMELDKYAKLSLLKSHEAIVKKMSVDHETTMESHRDAIVNNSNGNKRKLDSLTQVVNSWNGRVSNHLSTAQYQVEKLLREDLCRDEPTGFTPERREFNFPRKLAATSPHETIVKRFKKTHEKLHDLVEQQTCEDENQVEKETLKEQGAEFATPLKDVNLSSVYSTPLQINMRASMPEEMNESVEMKEKAPMQLDSSQVLSVSDATTGGLKNAFVPALIQIDNKCENMNTPKNKNKFPQTMAKRPARASRNARKPLGHYN